jgi:hypothetical protein
MVFGSRLISRPSHSENSALHTGSDCPASSRLTRKLKVVNGRAGTAI